VRSERPSFTDVEYGNRRRVSRRERFLQTMDGTIPWATWVGLIEPFYYTGGKGRKPKPVETMLRMYLLQVWFSLSDEGVEAGTRCDHAAALSPPAGEARAGPDAVRGPERDFRPAGLDHARGSIVDATIIAAPSSTKNATGTRDPAMRQTKKGNQWFFGMKAHIGTDAGTGYVHSVTATAASVHDLDQITDLVRADDEVVYADAGYQGVEKRPDVAGHEHLSGVQFRVAARKSRLASMAQPDRQAESRQASVRAKVEHPFLIVKRDFGFTKTRYRGIAKNLNHLHMLFASANWLMRARAVALTG
jgi:transposase, IS5 family